MWFRPTTNIRIKNSPTEKNSLSCVSLDQSKELWMKAIAKDNLYWPYHISDLKGWQSSAAALYGVNSIPTNFLIDGKGVIIGKSLRGPELESTLDKYLKQTGAGK